MSDTTETETETDTNTDTTDEPSKAELHERVEQLELTVEKLMPSRRDVLKFGAAGIAGAAGVAGASQPAAASTGSAGDIGDPNNRPDLFADTVDANQLTGASVGADRQGCRVILSSDQSISSSSRVKVQFDSEVYDSDSNFDTSTHNWTCPLDGLYAVHTEIEFNAGRTAERELIIGSGSSSTITGEGAFMTKKSSEEEGAISATTINKYQKSDTIAVYAQNVGSNDELRGGNDNFGSFLEVAFLGGF